MEPARESRRLFLFFVICGTVASLLLALSSLVESPQLPERVLFGGVLERARGNAGVQFAFLTHIWAVVVLLVCWCFAVARFDLRHLWIAFAAWTAPQMMALTGDVFNYVEQGWSVLQGADPTVSVAGSVPGPFSHWAGGWAGTTVGYPAGALLVSAAVVALAGAHPVGSLLLMHLPAVVGVVIAGLCLPRVALALGISPRLLFGLVIINPLTILELCGAAHNDALAFGLVVLAIWWAVRTQNGLARVVIAGVILGMASTVKPQALAFAALLPAFGLLQGTAGNVFRRSLRDYLEGIGTFGVAFLVLLTSGPLTGIGREFMSATGTPGYRSSAPFQIIRIPLESLLGERFTSLWVVQHFDTVCLALVVIATVAAVAIFRVTQPATMLVTLFSALFLLGPAFRPWYAIWLLLPLVLAPIRWNVKLPYIGAVMALSLAVKNPQALYLVNEVFAYVLAVAVFVVLTVLTRRGDLTMLNPAPIADAVPDAQPGAFSTTKSGAGN